MASFRRIRSAVKVLFVTSVVLALAAGFTAVRAAAQAGGMTTAPTELVLYPDTIMTNGKILTVDKDFSTRQAIAIRGDKILLVGTNAAVTRLAGPKTQRMDLGGKTMIPGIIDTHLHSMPSAMAENVDFIGKIEPRYRDFMNVAKIKGTSVADLLQQIKAVAATRQPGTWLHVQVDSPELALPFYDKVRRRDLDAVAPNNLVIVESLGDTVNTKMLEAIKAFYGNDDIELGRDETGMSDGQMVTTLLESIVADLTIDHPMQSLYPIFKAKMQKWASVGLTTDSGRIMGLWFQPVFREMERRHELPIRLAYSALGSQVNPKAGDFYMRLGDITDMGTDMLWMPGTGVVEVDMGPCTDMAPASGYREPCLIGKRTDPKRQGLFQAVKYGNRIANTHVAGDKSVDYIMDIIEEGSAAAGMTADEIKAKKHNIDHCTLNPRPDQIVRGVKLGVIWSCGGNRPQNAAKFAEEYGIEYANKLVAPVASIMKSGSIVAGHGEGMMGDSYFTYPEMLLTRKDSSGRTWGKDEAIDRVALLKMFTINGAHYVGRPDRMGSLEEGKFADLVVLDRDYMTIPIEDFSTLHPLLTMVGGKIVYQKEGTQWGPSR